MKYIFKSLIQYKSTLLWYIGQNAHTLKEIIKYNEVVSDFALVTCA